MEAHSNESGTKAEREAMSRLDGAWAQLNAINPDAEYLLVRTILERLQQQPQLQSMLVPPPLTKDGSSFRSIPSSNPSLSGSTLLNPMPIPKKEIRGHKRTQSASSLKKRGPRYVDDYIMEDVTEEIYPEAVESQLADVLYGRWLQGLRQRWDQ
jgi:serine/threonine-protein kinase 24/25/MST4